MRRRNIKNLSIRELGALIEQLDDKRHRTAQILKWLYQKGARGFSEMTNLPLSLRNLLEERFTVTSLHAVESQQSEEDTSRKFLLACSDGSLIEAVLMEAEKHQTICISSQIGCPLKCAFCRTGQGGFERNLNTDEILNQVLFFRNGYLRPRRRFNIVLMGMGEPLLNMKNVGVALEILNSSQAFALGEKRITLSTIGFPDKIRSLARSALKFGLAISLNATTDSARKRIMPYCSDIRETLAAAENFAETRDTRTTLEYVLLAGINDSPEDANRLSALTSGRPFKINIIPFNDWPGSGFKRPTDEEIDEFLRLLLPKAPVVTVRRSQGRDIGAACGQLRIIRGKKHGARGVQPRRF